jgi:hypothetical protein
LRVHWLPTFLLLERSRTQLRLYPKALDRPYGPLPLVLSLDLPRLLRHKWDPMLTNASCFSSHFIPRGSGSGGLGMIMTIITTTRMRGASG